MKRKAYIKGREVNGEKDDDGRWGRYMKRSE
jgi:hypothetical protein